MRKKKYAVILTLSWMFLISPAQAHAACCGVLAGVLASIDATLKASLFDPLTGASVTRVLRDMQATDALNTAQITENNAATAEGVRNGMIAYNQEAEQLELYRRAVEAFPDPPADVCGEGALTETAADARKNLQAIQAKGSSAGAKRANQFESPGQVVVDYKKVLNDKGVEYVLGGTITQPGCKPVFSSDGPTLFENKVQLPTAWDCSQAQEAPLTIPKDKVEAAQYVLNSVVDFEPVPQSRVGDRKTPAGQVYEAERALHRAQMDIYRDFAHDALSMYLPTHPLNDEGRQFLRSRGVSVPDSGDISEMDYLSKQVQARWGSSEYMASLGGMEEKNILIAMQETQDLTNEILFRYVEMKNRESMVDALALSKAFNDKVLPVLQAARNKAVAP